MWFSLQWNFLKMRLKRKLIRWSVIIFVYGIYAVQTFLSMSFRCL